MAFPYDFGFVPRSLAPDGDPIDVLVSMDEAAFAGCVVDVRVIGVIEGHQGSKKARIRNDRVVEIERDTTALRIFAGLVTSASHSCVNRRCSSSTTTIWTRRNIG